MNLSAQPIAALVLACAAAWLPLAAGAAVDAGASAVRTQATRPAADMADGEVRKIDKEAGKITLKHGEIKSLDMPPMTMVFTVKDKALLDTVKAGDKVRFRAINDAGKYTVTEVQVVR